MSEPSWRYVFNMPSPAQSSRPPVVRSMARSVLMPLKRLWPLLVLVAGAVLVLAMGWERYLSLSELTRQRDLLHGLVAEHTALMVIAYMLLYGVTVALSLPTGAVLTLAGGFLFGWFWGGIVATVAATFGAIAVFLIAKSALGETLAAKAGPRFDRLRKGFRENAFNYLLALRLIPVVPFWLVNLAPGALGVPLGTYSLATVIGILPGTFAYSLAGAGLDQAIAAQGKGAAAGLSASAFLTPQLIIGLIGLGLLALLPVVVKHFRKTAP